MRKRSLTPQGKETLLMLRSNPHFVALLDELEELHMGLIPQWRPSKTYSEPELAYWSGMRDGVIKILSQLEGEHDNERSD